MDRRQFLSSISLAGGGLFLGWQGLAALAAEAGRGGVLARHWEKLPGRKVRCLLCPHGCVVGDGERGACRVRENRGGSFFSLNHSALCAVHLDPIEKKPLFHYKPGATAYSIAGPGCNFTCRFCQNWQISQARPEDVGTVACTPQETALGAKKAGATVIAYTYSEPVVFYEHLWDTATAARALGVGNVMISNGFIRKDPLVKLIPKLSAIKIDFKGFSDSFYATVCGGKLRPVLDTLVTLRASGLWLEIVTLVIPTLNDAVSQNRALFEWVKANLSDEVPLHLTRFSPCYKLANLPPTPLQTLERLWAEARDVGLKYVYIGNVPGHPKENTYCHGCGRMIIQRVGFKVVTKSVQSGKCIFCQTLIPGVFS